MVGNFKQFTQTDEEMAPPLSIKKKANDTDDELSSYQLHPQQPKPKAKKIHRARRKLRRSNRLRPKIIFHEKIMRFQLPNSKKTLRVYCYNEEDFGWPVSLAEKINTQEADNDQDSNSSVIEDAIERNLNSLMEAAKEKTKL